MARCAIIENGVVVNMAEAEAAFATQQGWIVSNTAQIGWLYDGQTFSPPPPPVKSPEEIQQEITDATQKRLDDWAKTRNYDGILSLCTYATSSVPNFAAEGQCGVDNRDQTWATLYTIMDEVQQGMRPMPTGFSDIEPDLPALEWPAA